MYKIGMTAPNDGRSINDMLQMPFGTVLVIHDGASSVAYTEQVRLKYPDAMIIVRFMHKLADPVQDIINTAKDWYPVYKAVNRKGQILFTFFNEPDGAEGGHGVAFIRDKIHSLIPAIRAACPGIAICGPNFASVDILGNSDEWVRINNRWRNIGLRSALTRFDLLLAHAYVDSKHIDTLGRYFENPQIQSPDGAFHPNPLFGKLWGLSEYSSVGLNSPKAPLGVEGDAYDAIKRCYTWNNCVSIVFFMWYWANPQPGGEGESIVNDPATLSALRRAFNDFGQIVTPVFPKPLDPIEPPVNPPTPPTPPIDPQPEPQEPIMTNRERYEPLARVIWREETQLPSLENVFVNQITQESNWNPTIVSPSGAEGLGQLMPQYYPNVDRFDPEDNLRAAASSMKTYLEAWKSRDDYVNLALASYNAGLTAMRKWVTKFGDNWRKALVTNRNEWNAVAGYADAKKADQVALYLNEIVGTSDTGEDMARLPMETIWSPNRGGKRAKTIGVVIHSTRGGKNHSLETEYSATVNWFKSTGSGLSAHYVVGPHKVAHMVPVDDVAVHARWLNDTHVGIEVCQPLPTTPYTESQYQETAAIVRDLIKRYGINVRRIINNTRTEDNTRWGIVGHEDSYAGKVDGKSDPGAKWDWNKFMRLVAGELEPVVPPTPPTPPTPVNPPVPHAIKTAIKKDLDEWWYYQQLLDDQSFPWHANKLREVINNVKKDFGIE